MLQIAINGAGGRMGQRLGALAGEADDLTVTCAIDAADSPHAGADFGALCSGTASGVTIDSSATQPFDVLIDFSVPAGTMAIIDQVVSQGKPMVIGTTGFEAEQSARIDKAAGSIPIVHAPNMSVGINLLLKVIEQVTAALGEEYDVEIVESHHRFKRDAPSGTANALLASVCRARGVDADTVAVHGRHGGDAIRQKGQIGMHALRRGDVVGQHDVSFTTLGETIHVGHAAHTRDTFTMGALRAARWVADKPAGKYTMQDVLFG